MPCVWCERDVSLTKEHVLPRWLKSQEVISDGFEMAPGASTETITPEGVNRTIRTGPCSNFDTVVKVVCERCNGGWMSRLEGRAMAPLKKIVRGEEGELSESDCVALATWTCKTGAMLSCLANRGSGMTRGELDHLFDRQEPPLGMLVFSSRFIDDRHSGMWSVKALTVEVEGQVFQPWAASAILGRTELTCFAPRGSGLRLRRDQSKIVSLWPFSCSRWKPDLRLDAEARSLLGDLDAAIQGGHGYYFERAAATA
jgi:hypothetical protein